MHRRALDLVGVIRAVERCVKRPDHVVVGHPGSYISVGEDGGGRQDAGDDRADRAADLRAIYIVSIQRRVAGHRVPGHLQVIGAPVGEGQVQRYGRRGGVAGGQHVQQARVGGRAGEDAIRVGVYPVAAVGGGEAIDVVELAGVLWDEIAHEFVIAAHVCIEGGIRPPDPVGRQVAGGAKADLRHQAGGRSDAGGHAVDHDPPEDIFGGGQADGVGDLERRLQEGIINVVVRHGRSFVGVNRFQAVAADSRNHVVVQRAVDHGRIGVGCGDGGADHSVAAARNQAAVNIVAHAIRRGSPGQVHLALAFDSHQVGGRVRRGEVAADQHQHGAPHGGDVDRQAAIRLDGVLGVAIQHICQDGAGGQVTAEIEDHVLICVLAIEHHHRGIWGWGKLLAPVSVEQVGIIDQQRVEGAGAQRRVGVAGSRQQLVVVEDVVLA